MSTVPADLRRALVRAAKEGAIVDYPLATSFGSTVMFTCYSPKGSRTSWRVYWKGAGHARSATSTPEGVYAKMCAAIAEMDDEHTAATSSLHTVAEMLDAYMASQVTWVPNTRACRRRDLDTLRRVAGHLTCRNLSKDEVNQAIRTAGSAKRGKFLRNQILQALTWAEREDYINPEQLAQVRRAQWGVPLGNTSYIEPANRRNLPRQASGLLAAIGEVPTTAQVNDWAGAMLAHYEHGEALLHLLAATGLRMGEVLALTASPELFATVTDPISPRGNFVDLETWTIQVNWQVSGVGGKHLTRPKGGKIRTVPIPEGPDSELRHRLRTAFALRQWLLARCEQALAEPGNPRSLLFPNPAGDWWGEERLSRAVVVPATESLGWDVYTVVDAHGRRRRYQRFTPHSLRDFFAVTAKDTWKWPQRRLKEVGGWADIATMMRYYYGSDDDDFQ